MANWQGPFKVIKMIKKVGTVGYMVKQHRKKKGTPSLLKPWKAKENLIWRDES